MFNHALIIYGNNSYENTYENMQKVNPLTE